MLKDGLFSRPQKSPNVQMRLFLKFRHNSPPRPHRCILRWVQPPQDKGWPRIRSPSHPGQRPLGRRRADPLADIFGANTVLLLTASPGPLAVPVFTEDAARPSDLDTDLRRTIELKYRPVPTSYNFLPVKWVALLGSNRDESRRNAVNICKFPSEFPANVKAVIALSRCYLYFLAQGLPHPV